MTLATPVSAYQENVVPDSADNSGVGNRVNKKKDLFVAARRVAERYRDKKRLSGRESFEKPLLHCGIGTACAFAVGFDSRNHGFPLTEIRGAHWLVGRCIRRNPVLFLRAASERGCRQCQYRCGRGAKRTEWSHVNRRMQQVQATGLMNRLTLNTVPHQ